MLEFIRSLIQEAVTALAPEVPYDRNQGKALESHIYPREKIITLCRNIIKRYGFVSKHESDTSSYDRALGYISKGGLATMEEDNEFCSAFLQALFNNSIPVSTSRIFLVKAEGVLRARSIKVMHISSIMPAVRVYMESVSMSKSKAMDKDDMIFYKLKLKRVISDSSAKVRGTAPAYWHKEGDERYTFQDQKGNYYVKVGAPPAVHMRISVGNGNLLAKLPYEMRLNDVFTFRGKVERTFITKAGAVMNVIGGVQPI